jgi:phosphohistidine phosphatase
MNLFLVRHGQAKSEAEDPARSLSNAGAEAAKKVAKWLGGSEVKVNEIRHSGKKRAEQTASIFAEHLSPPQGLVAASGLNPMDDVRRVANELRECQGSLMIVGHLPFLGRLTGLLVAGDPGREVVRFRNAGVVCLQEYEGRWSVEWVMVPSLVR